MLSAEAISQRTGQVLIKDTILKADHFPGCQNKSLLPTFEDAPNFRQVPELPIFGVAIPTVAGFRIVLDILDAKNKCVLWHNLREEPLLYVNGHPYVVRDADKPFANLEYTGIDQQRVEAMEERLKQDVIQEMKLYKGRVLLSGENDHSEVIQYWEEVTEAAIQTPQDVFHLLVQQEGFQVDYLRVPVTDEKAPKEIDCDLLLQRCWAAQDGTSLVFNCQMGRGRTTTGMIIASLLHLRRLGVFPQGVPHDWVPDWFLSPPSATSKGSSLKQGYYGVVRSLLRILECGVDAKKVLDVVIDANSQMQNLREAIHKYREHLCQEQNERKRNALLHASLEYLERYCVLIAFASYISHPHFDPSSSQHVTFSAFMARRPEFRSVLQRLLRRNPTSALGLRISIDSNALQPVRSSSLNRGSGSSFAVTRWRRGKVLGCHTILKEDHFPGIEADTVQQVINGAPNFRGVTGLPVYGVGMPTVDGIRSVLDSIGAGPSATNKTPAVWFNWREEPLVYINGRPFVLREDQRPFKNLKEYSNIDVKRLEKMEERLRQDVQDEASAQDGWILVALETPRGSEAVGMLEDKWEEISIQTSVQTSASIYAMLQKEGYAVHYHRIPLTDGKTPDVLDVDQILRCMEASSGPSSVVFNCQNGVGRTTVGMVLASLAFDGNSHSPVKNSAAIQSMDPTERLLGSSSMGPCASHRRFVGADGESEECSVDETEVDDDVSWSPGGFLAVRRLTRLLDNGPTAKQIVDVSIDSCDLIVNIRNEIGQFRRGHRRPETSHRHTAYYRGVAYLHRYCFLIAVAAYLNGPCKNRDLSFHHWMTSRQDIVFALNAVLQNPSAALSILLPRTPSNSALEEASAVSAKEEQFFLSQRQFPVLNARSILKGGRPTRQTCSSSGIPDLKRVRHRHVYTMGDPSVKSLRKLLEQFRADPSIPQKVILRDIREELIVYINGFPYTRRDLERPISSLYHAGVATADLERMEEGLQRDVLKEAELHNGTVLLHEELPLNPNPSRENGQRVEHHRDDITHLMERVPSVVAIKGDIEAGVSTPKDVYKCLVEEGYPLIYARVPLSRSRTPRASDLDQLRKHMGESEEAVCIIVARASTGSSARFAAAFLSMIQPPLHLPSPCFLPKPASNSKLALGEYRSIMHLCRALPNGLLCKASVDGAIDDCVRIGSLREDILSCIYALDTNPQTHQLGLHYLKRYFFLIAFQCYSNQNCGETFEDWVNQRKELCHLVATLRLE